MNSIRRAIGPHRNHIRNLHRFMSECHHLLAHRAKPIVECGNGEISALVDVEDAKEVGHGGSRGFVFLSEDEIEEGLVVLYNSTCTHEMT